MMYLPGYSQWLQFLGLDQLDDMEPDQEEVEPGQHDDTGIAQLDLGLDHHDEV